MGVGHAQIETEIADELDVVNATGDAEVNEDAAAAACWG
jgi:hypothetical protein